VTETAAGQANAVLVIDDALTDAPAVALTDSSRPSSATKGDD
jgi:hypothetical protein